MYFQTKLIDIFFCVVYAKKSNFLLTFSRAQIVQCSILAGKDLTLQYGTSLSIGSFFKNDNRLEFNI